MSPDLISTVVTLWINNIFGTPLIAGIVVFGFFTLFGLRQGWNMGNYIVVLVPLIAITSAFLLPEYFFALVLIFLGILIGLALVRIASR